MKVENCGICLNGAECSRCKKVTFCGAFTDTKGKYKKKGEMVYFCQKCIDKLEKENEKGALE